MRMKNRKWLKKRYGAVVLVLLLLIGFSNSLQFRMSDQEITSYFSTYAAPEIRYLKLKDKKVRYLWQNNGHRTTAIFVHGAPGSSSAFIDFFFDKGLTDRVNVVSMDRPGYGYSDYGDAEPSLLNQAKVVSAIVDELDLEEVILVGHSLGAPIIAKAAFQRPERYAGLVMVAGSVDPDQEPVEWYRPWLRNWLAKVLLPSSLFVTNEEIFMLKDQLLTMEGDWKKLSIPLIVVQGDSDRLVPKENINFIQDRVEEQYLEIWLEPKVNHFIPWNRPDLIVNGILKLEGKL